MFNLFYIASLLKLTKKLIITYLLTWVLTGQNKSLAKQSWLFNCCIVKNILVDDSFKNGI